MKKVILITLWIIIASSALFLVKQGYFRPEINETALEQPPEIFSLDESDINNIILSDDTRTYKEYMALGNATLESQEFEKAIAHFVKAIEQDPSAEALFGLGQAYLGNNKPDSALESFRSAEKIQANSIDIQLGIVQALLDSREVEKAKELVWALDQEEARVQYYKALLLVLFREYEQAHEIFIVLADQNSAASPSVRQKAEIFLDKYVIYSYYPDGETIFLQTMLAKAMTETGQYQAAIPLLFDIINAKSNYRDAWIILGYAYLSSDKIQDAIDALDKAKNLDPEKPETLFFLGIAYSLNQNIDTAVKFLEKAEELGYHPQEEIQTKLGDLYLIQEEYQKSSNSYEKAISLNKNDMGIFVRTIWINIDKLNKPDKALEIAEQAIASHPSQAMSFNLMGWAHVANDNFNEAEEYLNQAIAIYPQFDAAHLNLGLMYEKQGQIGLAEEYYEKAIDLGKGNSISSLANKRIYSINDQENRFFQTNTLNLEP